MKYLLDVENTELWKQVKKQAAFEEQSISSLIQGLLEQYIELCEVLNRWDKENQKEGFEGYKFGFVEGFFWAYEIPKKDLMKAIEYQYNSIHEPFSHPLFKNTLGLCQENDEDLGEHNRAYTESWVRGFFDGLAKLYEKAESAISKKQQGKSK